MRVGRLMCGIVGTLGGSLPRVEIGIDALAHRGPDANGSTVRGEIILGHTRLSILDVGERSNQPFLYRDVALTYNGELWNYKELRVELEERGHKFVTSGDTEVVAAAIAEWGTWAFRKFRGMFALAWTTDGETLWLARDRYGEVPLHYCKDYPLYFASEVKALRAMGCDLGKLMWVGPGELVRLDRGGWKEFTWNKISVEPRNDTLEQASEKVREMLVAGAVERTISDVPVCTLLSGGIDSAAVAYALKGVLPNIVAYHAVLDMRSPDFRAARVVAEHLGIELREVIIPVPTAADMADVVRTLEMPSKAHVEIGWPCMVLARRMKEDGFKVTFSGEGSDEMWASYGFTFHALKTKEWHTYRRDLFLSQHRKNFARCNKIFLSHGVECRLPFLNQDLVEYAIGLKKESVRDDRSDKAVIQRAFAGLLPESITRRAKLAFQDGLGLKPKLQNVLGDPKAFYKECYEREYGWRDAEEQEEVGA